MGRKRGYQKIRAQNLKGGIKKGIEKLVEALTPRKRRKTTHNKENEPVNVPSNLPHGAQSPSMASLNVFSTPEQAAIAPSTPRSLMARFLSVFHASPHNPATPTSADATFYHTFHVSSTREPGPSANQSRRVTIEDIADEDESYLASRTRQEADDLHFDERSMQESVPDDEDTPNTPPIPGERDDCGWTWDYDRDGRLRLAPPIDAAKEALDSIMATLYPRRTNGAGHRDIHIDIFARVRLEGMRTLLSLYTNPRTSNYGHWSASSLAAAVSLARGPYCSRVLRKLCRAYITDRTILPINPYGNWMTSMMADEDLAQDVLLFLQELGKDITAKKLQTYLARSDVREKHGIAKEIHITTARRYLRELGFRFSEEKKGQYVDGHEREDVVAHRDNYFIPRIKALRERMNKYTQAGALEEQYRASATKGKRIVIWYHDESIFYAHDRRRRTWYHKDTTPKPYKKGDGLSLMVADYVSADYGWLRSLDGSRTARRIIRPGKNRDGYFTNEDILEQARAAREILREFPDDIEHIFIYDNATNHKKRAPDALSARHMPRSSKEWLVDSTMENEDGEKVPVKVPMMDAILEGGVFQSLYFGPGEDGTEGHFKGMDVILWERGWDWDFLHEKGRKAECTNFKCKSGEKTCCVRRILFNEPDFVNVKSLLEEECEKDGFSVIFLPKFHCELNMIEQCWGYAKRIYRLNPESSKEDALERNTLDSLESVPLEVMRRFGNRTLRFMDAYQHGLTGPEAAWAAKRYRGHRVLPDSIIREAEEAGIRKKAD